MSNQIIDISEWANTYTNSPTLQIDPKSVYIHESFDHLSDLVKYKFDKNDPTDIKELKQKIQSVSKKNDELKCKIKKLEEGQIENQKIQTLKNTIVKRNSELTNIKNELTKSDNEIETLTEQIMLTNYELCKSTNISKCFDCLKMDCEYNSSNLKQQIIPLLEHRVNKCSECEFAAKCNKTNCLNQLLKYLFV